MQSFLCAVFVQRVKFCTRLFCMAWTKSDSYDPAIKLLLIFTGNIYVPSEEETQIKHLQCDKTNICLMDPSDQSQDES